MTLRRRRSLIPSYDPPDGGPVTAEYLSGYFESVIKRFFVIGSCLAALGSILAFLGAQVVSPGQNTAQVAARVKAVEDSVREQSKRIAVTEVTVHDNLYITCQVLNLVQPPGAILPEKCVDALIANRHPSR
jgi:hypothetical protein